MPSYIKSPLPLITPRIEFSPAPPSPPPMITPRMEFPETLLIAPRNKSTQPPPRLIAPPGPHRGSSGPLHFDSELSDEEDFANSSSQIPKPSGQAGRKVGGYSVKDTLMNTYGWKEDDYNKIREEVHSRRTPLDTTRCYRDQDESAIAKLCDKIIKKFPELKLGNYANCWPVRDLIKLRLKYGSERARISKMKAVVSRVNGAIRESSAEA